jgi:hypothetical protein
MLAAIERQPELFRSIEIPKDAKRFKAELPELIVRFEALRSSSEHRVEIARVMADFVAEHTRLAQGQTHEPLAERLAAPSRAEAPVERAGTGSPGWTPQLSYRGRTYVGAELAQLADRLREDHQLTSAAADALRWMAKEFLHSPVDLSGERFVLLGAAAELSPAPYLLQAGARVLWVDRAPPPDTDWPGTVVHDPAAADLLANPGAILAAIRREAEHGPVRLGLYAYAPGKGRELLLAASMNAMVDALPAEAVASVALLVSPTTPGEVQPEDQTDRANRRSRSPRWQRAMARTGLLREPAHHREGNTEISRSIVSLQGPTYLAAQYLTKMMVAERWMVDRAPMRVSANVAGITHTSSLEHPLFLAGFLGAPVFGVEVFQPDQTRVLSTLIMLHDVLNPDAPGADPTGGEAAQARRLVSQAVHGGVRSLPFVFEHVIRTAAVIGLARRPSLLFRR